MTKTARMSHKQHQHLSKKTQDCCTKNDIDLSTTTRKSIHYSGGEVLQHCTNNKENMASLPGDLQADLFSNYTQRM